MTGIDALKQYTELCALQENEIKRLKAEVKDLKKALQKSDDALNRAHRKLIHL